MFLSEHHLFLVAFKSKQRKTVVDILLSSVSVEYQACLFVHYLIFFCPVLLLLLLLLLLIIIIICVIIQCRSSNNSNIPKL